jgi:hypothetical protein
VLGADLLAVRAREGCAESPRARISSEPGAVFDDPHAVGIVVDEPELAAAVRL